MARLAQIGLAALATSALATGPAFAAQGTPVQKKQQGVIGVSPSKRDLAGRPPASLGNTLVYNSTTLTYDTRVVAAPLFQNLDGSYGFHTTRRALREARRVLALGASNFTLRPDGEQLVSIRWLGLPRGKVAAYIALVVTGTSRPVPGVPVSPRIRIVSLNFLRLPGGSAAGRITDLRAEQAPRRTLRFLTRVRNTGKIHGSPRRTSFVIRDAEGAVVVRTRWRPDTVLPGAQREFPVVVKKILPAGRYIAVSRMQLGRSPLSRRRLAFTLTGPNELPTRKLEMQSLTASGLIDEAAEARSVVKNIGTAPSPMVVTARLHRVQGGQAVQPALDVSVQRFDRTRPGDVRNFDFELGKLEAGGYRVIAGVSDGTRRFNEYTVDFTAGKKRGLWEKLFDSPWFWVAAGLALLLLLALLIVFLLRRYRRRVEEELAGRQGTAPLAHTPPPLASSPAQDASPEPAHSPDPEAPAPAPAPTAGQPTTGDPVDLNRALAEELMQLPGVGRRAAQRIIDNRPYSAIEDLGKLEGFHSERVERLRSQLRV